MQSTRNPPSSSADFDGHVALLPTQFSAAPHAGSAAHAQDQSADHSPSGPQGRVTTHAIREVVVLEVAGRLSEVVEDLDRAIQLALAEGPRGVVCDLSGVLEGAEPGAVEVLATAGRYVRDWSGIPVAVACPDPRVRMALADHALGGHLIVTASMFSAVSMVLVTPTLAHEWLRLAPHPSAPGVARDFVTRALLEWELEPMVLSAGLVISELVTSSMMNSTTDVDLSVAWNLGALRLTVRNSSPALPRQPLTAWDLRGSRLTAVAALSRASGVLPTADGGKVVWAVLNAARPRALTSRRRAEPATAVQESQMLTGAPGLAGLSFRVVSRLQLTGQHDLPAPGGDDTSAG